MLAHGEAYNADAYKDWEAAHASVNHADAQRASECAADENDLSTVTLAAASV